MFVSTDTRWPYPRGVIGSTVGAYPRGTGSNPVEGNGHFFSLISSALVFSLTHMHVHSHTCVRTHTAAGVFRNACLWFMMELVGECLKCLLQLTRGVPALVV